VRGNRYSISRDARAPRRRLVGWFSQDRIREALRMAAEKPRHEIPKGLWFTRHAFGARDAHQWRRLWRALHADGIRPERVDRLDDVLRRRAAIAAEAVIDRMAGLYRAAFGALVKVGEAAYGGLTLAEFEAATGY